MRRDKALNVFLFFVLASVLFITFFPVYFSFEGANFRVVALSERLFSLVFVSLWIILCVYSAWKKKLYLVLGGAAYAIMAYLPGWILPLFPSAVDGKDPSLLTVIVRFVFGKMYELVNAPMVGVSIFFEENQSVSLSRWLLPILVFSYVLTQVFRYYRNAYLAEQLHLEDTAYYPNPDLAREIASVPGTERVPVYATRELAREAQVQADVVEPEASAVQKRQRPMRHIPEPMDELLIDSSEEEIADVPGNDKVIVLDAPAPAASQDQEEIIILGPPEETKECDTVDGPVSPRMSDFDIEIKTDAESNE